MLHTHAIGRADADLPAAQLAAFLASLHNQSVRAIAERRPQPEITDDAGDRVMVCDHYLCTDPFDFTHWRAVLVDSHQRVVAVVEYTVDMTVSVRADAVELVTA